MFYGKDSSINTRDHWLLLHQCFPSRFAQKGSFLFASSECYLFPAMLVKFFRTYCFAARVPLREHGVCFATLCFAQADLFLIHLFDSFVFSKCHLFSAMLVKFFRTSCFADNGKHSHRIKDSGSHYCSNSSLKKRSRVKRRAWT